MPPEYVRFFMGLVALIAVIGFIILYIKAIYRTWTKPPVVTFPPQYVHVATALAGLIGGVAAMIFNENLPPEPGPGTPPAASASAEGTRAAPLEISSKTGPEAATTALLRSVVPQEGIISLSFVSVIYVACYFLTGLGAIITWLAYGEQTPDLVKNLALISIGLFVAIARSFFHVPQG
jgi:hypothetical protein